MGCSSGTDYFLLGSVSFMEMLYLDIKECTWILSDFERWRKSSPHWSSDQNCRLCDVVRFWWDSCWNLPYLYCISLVSVWWGWAYVLGSFRSKTCDFKGFGYWDNWSGQRLTCFWWPSIFADLLCLTLINLFDELLILIYIKRDKCT